jgi:hypothetical protein
MFTVATCILYNLHAFGDEVSIVHYKSDGFSKVVETITDLKDQDKFHISDYACSLTVNKKSIKIDRTITYGISCLIESGKKKVVVSAGFGNCDSSLRKIGNVTPLNIQIQTDKGTFQGQIVCN